MYPPSFPKLVLGLDAAAFFAVGVCFLAAPQWLMAKIDLEAGSGTALADVRAVYGGLDAGIGIFLLLCLARKWIVAGLWCATLALGALAAGRVLGLLLDAPHASMTYILLSSEIVGFMLSAAALSRACLTQASRQ